MMKDLIFALLLLFTLQAEILNETEDGVMDDAILILAGDFINKGPRSMEVLQFVMNNDNVYASVSVLYWRLMKY